MSDFGKISNYEFLDWGKSEVGFRISENTTTLEFGLCNLDFCNLDFWSLDFKKVL
jgi:hypothetical protein